jgi:branched-chain amino acid transport system ATP-binding protein
LLLSVRGLTAGYGTAQALYGIELEVHEGEIVSLLGANGAGKTTTLRAISGMIRSWGGEIVLGGRRFDREPPEARARWGLGHLPEGRGILSSLTVRENLMLGATVRRDGAAAIRRDRDRLLERFPALAGRLDQRAGMLSGGQQQMLGLARALLARPHLLMIDELSFGLAPVVVEELLQLVREAREAGTSFLLVEQSTSVLAISDRTYVISSGRTLLEDRSTELRARGAESLARVYLGTHARDAQVSPPGSMP